MSDAFSGFDLSKATRPSSQSVDQRLFASPPPPAAPNAPPSSDRVQPAPSTKQRPVVPRKEPVVRHNGVIVKDPRVSPKPAVATPAPPPVPLDSARSERPLSEPETRSTVPFDINEKPWRKDSFLFTDTEFERLEDLKLELRRRFELPATKNDIARAALQGLYEDYARDPEKSRIVRSLRRKNG